MRLRNICYRAAAKVLQSDDRGNFDNITELKRSVELVAET